MTKPFSLDSLLDEIDTEELDTFSDSDILQKIENGDLEPGQQIWIFHNRETDCHWNRWNCIACVNPYAHVVVFVGSKRAKSKQGDGKVVHEVVHVSKSWKCCTMMKAEICREDITKVKVKTLILTMN